MEANLFLAIKLQPNLIIRSILQVASILRSKFKLKWNQISINNATTTDVRHIAGKANLVADALSRASLSVVVFSPPDLDFVAMAQAQQIPEIQAYRTAITGL